MTVTHDLLDAFEPWMTPDLGAFLRVIGGMFAEVERYAADGDEDSEGAGTVGWGVMLDPDLCPAAGLPYLAQWVGERLPAGISEADARTWIKDAPNQDRGTPESIVRAAQRWLTGSRLVWLKERSKLDGTVDSDWIAVITYTSQTPNVQRVRDELRKVVPGDIEMDYATTASALWSAIDSRGTWGQVRAAYPTWAAVSGSQPGFTAWTSNYV